MKPLVAMATIKYEIHCYYKRQRIIPGPLELVVTMATINTKCIDIIRQRITYTWTTGTCYYYGYNEIQNIHYYYYKKQRITPGLLESTVAMDTIKYKLHCCYKRQRIIPGPLEIAVAMATMKYKVHCNYKRYRIIPGLVVHVVTMVTM